ncbi:MAG: DUF1592 domain-containing protein [Verrucomicrobiales bacterium]|nr:DUF1592 domain-containing protein [Verrucomicrobiales bacterium]
MRLLLFQRFVLISLFFGGLDTGYATDAFSTIIKPVFQQHCVQCHGENGKVKGKVNLLEIQTISDLSQDLEVVQELIEVIDFEEMPPEDEPLIAPETRKELLGALESVLAHEIHRKKQFSRAPIRRMNRFQYHNAVTDLFDLNRVVFALPERMMREHRDYFKPETGKMGDFVTVGSRPLGKSQLIEPRLSGVAPFPQDLRAEHGYDNRGDHLSLSPLLMESFLKLSQSITGSPDFGPKSVGIWKTFFEPPARDLSLVEETKTRLSSFLTIAFREPVEPEVLNRYHHFAIDRIEAGIPYTEIMKSVAAAAIASPKFLYLYDQSTSDQETERIDDLELASRLSFFLWGSIPDEELLDLAAENKLHQPAVLESQFRRMVTDQKLKRFCDSFPAQWLQLERIISSTPNRKEFPEFYTTKFRKSMHMMAEPLLLFETVLIENQPITQLIDSDFTYRSPQLTQIYGKTLATPQSHIDEVPPEERRGTGGPVVLGFDRIPVTDRRNGGVITNAAVMTMTSGPERTQPITRGAWIAGVIFNNPPEPPPADVPALGEKPPEGEEHLTLRERLSQHRERSDCKGCHEQIDPLGFALENYNPIGKWREKYHNGREIDISGTLFRKHNFNSVEGFKDAILAEKDRFARAFAGHLLSFALARELGPADQPSLDRIAEAAMEDNYKIQTLMKELILSESFLSKTNPLNPSPTTANAPSVP